MPNFTIGGSYMDNVVYAASVTEYESGWGQRSDGYLLAMNKPSFDEFAKYINSGGSHGCFSKVGEPRLIAVTSDMYEKIKISDDKAVWTSEKEKNWYVEG